MQPVKVPDLRVKIKAVPIGNRQYRIEVIPATIIKQK